MSTPSPLHLLRQAIKAARQGDRSRARMFLAKVTELDPEEPLGWIWRAGVAEEPEQALVWINRALELDPEQPNARRALATVRLQAALAIAGGGDFATARQLFEAAAEADQSDILPWLNLADMARSHEEARYCLGEILRREPNHAGAHACLKRLADQQQRHTPASPLSPTSDTIDDFSVGRRSVPVELDAPAEFEETSPAHGAARVMIVDDNPTVLEFVKRHLEGLGLNVTPAASADEAFAALSNFGPPDLFLIDASMPRIDGLRLGEQLRRDADFARTPMILLTLDDEPDTYFSAAAVGFRSMLCKPISPVSLREAVKKYCPVMAASDTQTWPELPEGGPW